MSSAVPSSPASGTTTDGCRAAASSAGPHLAGAQRRVVAEHDRDPAGAESGGGTASGRDRGIEAETGVGDELGARSGRPMRRPSASAVTTSTGMPGRPARECGDGVAGEGVGEGGPRGAGKVRDGSWPAARP